MDRGFGNRGCLGDFGEVLKKLLQQLGNAVRRNVGFRTWRVGNVGSDLISWKKKKKTTTISSLAPWDLELGFYFHGFSEMREREGGGVKWRKRLAGFSRPNE